MYCRSVELNIRTVPITLLERIQKIIKVDYASGLGSAKRGIQWVESDINP